MADKNADHEHSREYGINQPETSAAPVSAVSKSGGDHLPVIRPDPWRNLRQYTAARIALGRAGVSLPTTEVLAFDAAHAMARDAVHHPLNLKLLVKSIREEGLECLSVKSQAENRASYLLRPDLGRRLCKDDKTKLLNCESSSAIDILLVVGDGLSALAIENHALNLIRVLRLTLPDSLNLGPIIVASQARVALGDELGEILKARIVVMLIGERPGLNSPDSLGVYLTYNPNENCSDADRNCISNIRAQGLGYDLAVQKLLWLIKESISNGVSGVELKDRSDIRELKSE